MTQCWIYKGSKKAETYLYVTAEDSFDAVPAELLEALGDLSLVMDLELHPNRMLANADIEQVLSDLSARGYFLQLPPPKVGTEVEAS